jgi:hypothetical protein
VKSDWKGFNTGRLRDSSGWEMKLKGKCGIEIPERERTSKEMK